MSVAKWIQTDNVNEETRSVVKSDQSELDTKTPVLVCGLLAADIVFGVNEIPCESIKYRAENVSLRCGGGGCYASVAINRLGGASAVVARVGDDEFEKIIASALDAEGIDRTHVIVDQRIHTPVSSIALDQAGERQIVNYRDQSPQDFTNKFLFHSSPRAVLVDARWIEGSISSLEYAKLHNIPGVVDAESPVSEAVMDLATHIAFSRQGLSQFSSTDSVKDGLQVAAKRFPAWVCVTDGENGTHVWSKGRVLTLKAPQVNAIDTLGAGDVWHGSFTLQLAKGVNELNAVEFANTAAAIKCTRSGGGWSAPTLLDVKKYLDLG